jgi:ATP-dependent DNA ligase
MTIKQIFDEIAAESGNNAKIEILRKYSDNELLKKVLYMANSKRVKFYLKRVPEYTDARNKISLSEALGELELISNRELTGNSAVNHLIDLLSLSEPDDAYIIERIIEKDCKIGMGTTFMNKVFKGLIEDTPYMGAVSFDEKKARKIFEKGGKGISQIKMDGRYCNAVIRSGEVEMESRQGEPTILTGAKFLDELSSFEDCVLNGELTMIDTPRYESNGIIASLIDILGKKVSRTEKENEKKLKAFTDKHGSLEEALDKIRYTVWDRLTVDEYFNKSSKLKYVERLAYLEKMIYKSKPSHVNIVESVIVHNYAQAMTHFQEVLSAGEEGTILKSWNGEWKDGKPTWQIKMKLEMDVDLRIVGFNYGTKGTKNENVISSLNCESSDGLVKTRPQGFTEELMQYVTENQENLLGTVIQCKCNGLSNDIDGNYSLLYPSFAGFRDDKDTCDSLESIKEIENMNKTLLVE